MPTAETLLAVAALVDLHRLVADRPRAGGDWVGNRCGASVLLRFSRQSQDYCEKTDSELVVAVVTTVRTMSLCSTKPAERVTTSKLKSLPGVVTLNVVPAALISPLGVTLVPDTLR